MALQKKNDLLRSHLAVLLFWFIGMFLLTRGFDLKLLSASISYAMVVMFVGALTGVLMWLAVDMTRRDGVLAKSGAHSFRGANVSIGDPPVAREPVRGKPSGPSLASRFPWWGAYSKNHPAEAKAFMAILSVMHATPRLPASPVTGGHGGATLIEHSFNVVDTMMQMAPKWSYRGHRNKRGEIAFPLLDNTIAEFRFHPDDPIVPLVAFAHDIGKTACYKLNDDGSVREARRNHDIEGAKILRAIPEIMELSWKDRMAILTACEFYHHIGSLPYSTWIDDRARALVELLIAADVATGQREGGVLASEYEDADLIVSQQPHVPDGAEPDTTEDGEDGDTLYRGADEDDSHSGTTGLPRREPASEGIHGTALDLAYSALLEPGRVNGANASARIAWKHGEWIYISDAKLRAAIAVKTGDSAYNVLPHRGNMHPFTLDLMAQLAANKHLLQEHNGQRFSEKRALYTTVSSVAGKTPVESKFVLVASVKAFPGLENAADCKAAPEIAGCSWGEKAAINKSGPAQDDGGAEINRPIAPSGDIEEPPKGIEELQKDADILIKAAAEMRLPFTNKSVDGVDFVFFEEDFIRKEFPDIALTGDRFIEKTGGKSGKKFIGVRKN